MPIAVRILHVQIVGFPYFTLRSGKYDTQAQVLTYDVKLLPQTTPVSNSTIRFSPMNPPPLPLRLPPSSPH